MHETSRRDFLKQAGAGMAGIAVCSGGAIVAAPPPAAIPPHRPLELQGVHAYPTEHSLAAGETLALHVSNSVPYQLAICRLGLKVDDPEGDEVLLKLPQQEARPLPIHPGSYVHVENRLTGPLTALTLECWVRLWKPLGPAGILTQFDHPQSCGVGLLLRPSGEVVFYLGDGEAFQAEREHLGPKDKIKPGQWYHLAGTWDGKTKTLYIDGDQAGSWPGAGRVHPGKAPLRIGAAGENGLADRFLDADVAMPVIYDRALSAQEVRERFGGQGLQPATPPAPPLGKGGKGGVLACWPLEEERGERVADCSGTRRDGRIINHATWMIGGPSFNANVTRFGKYEPAQDKTRGHGLRFASDDLYDCRWPVRHDWRVPAKAKSGLYVVRMQYEYESRPRLNHVTFIVRPPLPAPPGGEDKVKVGRKQPPILVVAASNTWRSYSGTAFTIPPPGLKHVWGTGGIANPKNNPPAYNFYRAHAAGQGTCQVGLRMPWPSAGPYVLYGGLTEYSHLMRADRFLHVWLEQSGYDFDVISDVDLHRRPDILRGYQVFMIAGHNEYWSIPMFEGLEAYLKAGGNVIALSGNTIFWRVSFNEDCTVMECRKVDAPGNQLPPARRGEAWHSQDGRRGGMMRECGYPGWRLIALDTLGWNNPGIAANFGPFVVEDPDHFLFNKPEKLGFQKGERIGQAGEGQVPMANGHEFDVRPSTLAAMQEQPTPQGAAMPQDPPGIHRIANGIIPWKRGGSAFDYFFRAIKPKTDQGGEMIYWERPDGGRLFNAATIGFGWALLVDPKLQGLLRNVLAHFGVPKPK